MKGKLALLALFAGLLAASAPAWPDDWDGLGFVASIAHFDMARFAPHPPGYPVYVAALKLVALVVRSPVPASIVVSVGAALATAALAWSAAARAFGKERAWAIAVAVSIAPLAWRADSGVGSEALALAFAALTVSGLARGEGIAVGLGVGLGLGVRLSWAPLYLALLALAPRGARLRAWGTSAIASGSWAAALLAIVGPSRLVALYATHLSGHTTRWGGTALVDPGAGRFVYFARDLFVDGLGMGTDGLGLVIGFLVLAVGGIGLAEWRRDGWPRARVVLVALAPYAAWILLGQNLRQQPRHALPLVVAMAAGLALAAMSVDRARKLGVALVTLVAARTSQDALARVEAPPPGEQLVLAVRELPHPERVVVFGGPSVRFFEGTDLAARARPAGSMGDVRLALGAMNELPAKVLVTSELDGFRAPPYPSVPWKTLCRPERIDRRAPCLDVAELRVPFLPAQ